MRPLEKIMSEADWGLVPAIGGDPVTATPNPADPTAPTATTEQQAESSATQKSVQTITLPPPPPPNACITADGRGFTHAFYTWLIQLQRRVGGYLSTPLSDDGKILDAFAPQVRSIDESALQLSALYDTPITTRAADDLGQFDHCGVAAPRAIDDLSQLDNIGGVAALIARAREEAYLTETPARGTHLTTWNDWNLSISGAKVPAANAPTWNAIVGNLNAYQFAVNDYLHLDAQEFLHNWKEGSDVQIHLHWVTGGLNDATVRGVTWEVEYSVCNPLEDGVAPSTFTSVTIASAEFSIPAAQPDRTHRVGTIAVIPGSTLKIGSQILLRLRRIAAVATAPAANPFAISLGLHHESDTPGSRNVFTK